MRLHDGVRSRHLHRLPILLLLPCPVALLALLVIFFHGRGRPGHVHSARRSHCEGRRPVAADEPALFRLHLPQIPWQYFILVLLGLQHRELLTVQP